MKFHGERKQQIERSTLWETANQKNIRDAAKDLEIVTYVKPLWTIDSLRFVPILPRIIQSDLSSVRR